MSSDEQWFDEESAAAPASGPFAVEPVDPLVYRRAADSPELRPAASYVPISSPLRSSTPKPVAPAHPSYPGWTPGGLPTAPPAAEEGRSSRLGATLIALAALAAPLGLIGLAVAYAVWALR